jgi:hypothetical protein
MMEEKRGLMGRNRSLSNDMACVSLIGTSVSKTEIMDMESTELLKYCPVGLTGSNPSQNSITVYCGEDSEN